MVDHNPRLTTLNAVNNLPGEVTPSTGAPTQKPTQVPPNANVLPESKRTASNEYATLKRLVKGQGLLDKQPLYYTFKISLTLGLLAASLAVLAMVDNLVFQLFNAAFLAFVFTQIGFIGHDAGHRQIFLSAKRNDWTMLVISFLIALDRSWWLDKHNQHHRNPNDLELDDDINVTVISISEKQALAKRGFQRFMVKHQAYFFFPILLLTGLSMRMAGVSYLLTTPSKGKYRRIEPVLMAAHLVVYLALVFYFLNPWHAVLFIAVNQMLLGLYMGSVFAPNHKGMLTIDGDSRLDFLRRQVLTTRNVAGSPLNDFGYGGLNYQIEHHLFPSMPRNNLKKAQRIIRPFCQQHSVSYHEVGALRANWEILQSLHQVSKVLKGAKAQRPVSP